MPNLNPPHPATQPQSKVRNGRKRFIPQPPAPAATDVSAAAAQNSDLSAPSSPAAQPGVFQVVLTLTEKRSLRRSSFRGLTFERMDLADADFRLARLSNVTFLQCDLNRADLRCAELQGCRFIECDLAAVRFGRNRLVDTDFRRCRNLLAEERQRILSMGGRWIGSMRE